MSFSFRSAAVFVALLFFIREGLDGLLRYGLASMGLTMLVYVPTALMTLYVIIRFLAEQKRKPYIISFFFVIIIGLSGIIGFLNSGNIIQTIFALYVFVPFFFGLQTGDIIYKSSTFIKSSVILLLIFAVGIFLELVLDLPWKGFSYELGGVDIEASRDWSSLGLKRLSGFARNSFSIASLCMVLLIVLYGRIKPALFSFLFIIGGVSIILTTTKGVSLIVIVLVLLFIVKKISKSLYHFGIKTILISSFIIGIILPVSTLWIDYDFDYDNFITRMLFLSFEMRLGVVWPDAMAKFKDLADFIMGRGAGQIGVATMVYGGSSYNPADNFFLYTLVVFGIPFLIVLGFLLYRLFKMNGEDGYVTMLLMAMFIFTYGIFANVMESGILSYFLGSLISIVFKDKTKEIVEGG